MFDLIYVRVLIISCLIKTPKYTTIVYKLKCIIQKVKER